LLKFANFYAFKNRQLAYEFSNYDGLLIDHVTSERTFINRILEVELKGLCRDYVKS